MKIFPCNKQRQAALVLWLFLALAVSKSFCYGDLAHTHLKRLNKLALKSIKSTDGDIIDCVDISQQPAFDHPLLKTHSMQMKPTSNPNGFVKDKEKSFSQIWHLNGMCPEDTIPVRRTKREDILRASTIQNFGKKAHRSLSIHEKPYASDNVQTGHEHAVVYVGGEKYYGAKATMGLWNPRVQQPNEFSLAEMWIIGGAFGIDSDLNTIEAGWQVCPLIYGDNSTRLFIYWTNDYYNTTGCYNLLCSGFIQTSSKIAVGGAISPVSLYMGIQSTMTIYIWKDPKQGNWWLQIGDDDVVGYWPSELFSHLNDSATMIDWGGEVVNIASNGNHTTTEMGSGKFAEEGFGKASFFRNIQIVNESRSLISPDELVILTDTSNTCYDIKIGDVNISDWGSYFYYGGPGLSSACP